MASTQAKFGLLRVDHDGMDDSTRILLQVHRFENYVRSVIVLRFLEINQLPSLPIVVESVRVVHFA